MKFYLLLADGSNCFEEVDEFVFDNRQRAIDDSGNKRYDDLAIVDCSGDLSITGRITKTQMSILMRILSIDKFGGSIPGGILKEGNAVRFQPSRKGASGFLWYNGQKYKTA